MDQTTDFVGEGYDIAMQFNVLLQYMTDEDRQKFIKGFTEIADAYTFVLLGSLKDKMLENARN